MDSAHSKGPGKQSDRGYHHGRLEDELLEAATRAVEAGGAETLSLRALARRLGVSPNAPYRHFKGRDDLLDAVSLTGFTRLIEAFERSQPEVDALGQAYLTFAGAHPALFRLMFSSRLGSTEPGHPLFAESMRAYEVLKGAVAAQLGPAAQGMVVEAAALGLWSLVHGLATLRIDGLATGEHSHAPRTTAPDASGPTARACPPPNLGLHEILQAVVAVGQRVADRESPGGTVHPDRTF